MRCPTIKALPPPPSGKSGWPWNMESMPVPERRPSGSSWPRITVVTPSLNQGPFIEETIRSVLLQGYPDIEYIIMDGGSTDGTVEVIRKYEEWLTHWQSGPDRGQSHAINTGFGMATGELLAWLNSDDHFCADAFYHVARPCLNFKKCTAIVGACRQVDHVYRRESSILPQILTREAIAPWYFGENQIAQPSCFVMAWAAREAGKIREDLHYVFDYEYWLRLLDLGPFYRVEQCLSEILVHPGVKPLQNPGKAFSELIQVMFEMGYQDVACFILETVWNRKHRIEDFIFKLKNRLPGPLPRMMTKVFKRIRWI
jgi:glycosyltransferase involved in cell wall biosynthesis